MTLSRTLQIIALIFATATPALAADGYVLKQTKSSFDSVLFELNNAIVDKGLVIDYTGHVHDMLTRTGEATGSKSPYKQARYLHFCSAKLTHAAVAADPENLAICPYVVFAYELTSAPGIVKVGYRRPIGATSAASKAALADIEKLLGQIVADAVK